MSEQEVSVNIDIKGDKVSKTCAIELVKSMNLGLSKITGYINSMKANLSKQIGDLEANLKREINRYGTLDELTNRYITDLTSLLDVHAPLQQRLFLLRPQSPWYNEKLCYAKRIRRKLEGVWRTHGREPDRLLNFKIEPKLKNAEEIKKHYRA